MKTDENTHNLGSEWRPASTNWFYLVIDSSRNWKVFLEKDYDHPDKEAQNYELTRDQFKNYTADEVPLADVVAKKVLELGLNPN